MTRLGAGTTVSLTGLVARLDLNGVQGRVLKLDAASGRYGIRLPAAYGGGLLAVKPNNVVAAPLGVGGAIAADGTCHCLLALPGDLLECVLCHLSARALLRASATCAALHAIRVKSESAWTSLCSHPLIAPYHDKREGASLEAYRKAVRLRNRWHSGSSVAQTSCVLSFERFVRSVAVDFESYPHTIAVGLSSGAVACAMATRQLSVQYAFSVESLAGERHEEQAIAVALHAPSGLVVSGCGTPDYPVSYAVGPYAPTVKVWRLDPTGAADGEPATRSRPGHLVHTLIGHTKAVRKVLLLGAAGAAPPTHAASASADGSVIVWRLSDGQRVHTLAGKCGDGAAVVGLALLSDGQRLLSMASDKALTEWDWRAGTATRQLLPPGGRLGTQAAVSAFAYHEPTSLLAIGTRSGEIQLFAALLDRAAQEGPPVIPLAWAEHGSMDRLMGRSGARQRRDDSSDEVCCLQLDADKLVPVGRNGQMVFSLLRSMRHIEAHQSEDDPHEIMPGAPDCTSTAVRLANLLLWATGESDGSNARAQEPDLNVVPLRHSRVKFYVSTVCYKGGVLVSDGFDDPLCVTFF